MNSKESGNTPIQGYTFSLNPLPAVKSGYLKMSLLEGFLQNLSKYSDMYARLDHDPALTHHLYLVGKQVRNCERAWTKIDLIDIIRWRRLHPLARRITLSASELERLLNEALTRNDGDDRVEALCEIRGFGPVLASAILTLTWPDKYGFLTYHSWTALWVLGFDVSEKGFSGGGFTVPECSRFLRIIRQLANQAAASPALTADALYVFDSMRRKHRWA